MCLANNVDAGLLAELVVGDELDHRDVAERQQRTWQLLFVTRQTIERHVNILTYVLTAKIVLGRLGIQVDTIRYAFVGLSLTNSIKLCTPMGGTSSKGGLEERPPSTHVATTMDAMQFVTATVQNNKIAMFTKSTCGYVCCLLQSAECRVQSTEWWCVHKADTLVTAAPATAIRCSVYLTL